MRIHPLHHFIRVCALIVALMSYAGGITQPTVFKTFGKEVLTASDLNSSFLQMVNWIINNLLGGGNTFTIASGDSSINNGISINDTLRATGLFQLRADTRFNTNRAHSIGSSAERGDSLWLGVLNVKRGLMDSVASVGGDSTLFTDRVTLSDSLNALLGIRTGRLEASGGGSLTGTWTDLGTVTTVDINGGTVDGAVIGGSSAAAGTFTTLNTSDSLIVLSGGRFTGSLTIGTGAATHLANIYGADDAYVKIQATDANSLAGFIVSNDAQSWQMRVEGANNDAWELYDASGTAGVRLTVTPDGVIGVNESTPDGEATRLNVYDNTADSLPLVLMKKDNASTTAEVWRTTQDGTDIRPYLIQSALTQASHVYKASTLIERGGNGQQYQYGWLNFGKMGLTVDTVKVSCGGSTASAILTIFSDNAAGNTGGVTRAAIFTDGSNLVQSQVFRVVDGGGGPFIGTAVMSGNDLAIPVTGHDRTLGYIEAQGNSLAQNAFSIVD